jgi:hypothetical protein
MYRYECIIYYEYKRSKGRQLHERQKSDQEAEDLLNLLEGILLRLLGDDRDAKVTVAVGPSGKPQSRSVSFETSLDRSAMLKALQGLPAGLYTEGIEQLA